jgi:thiamine biosynthesis lipoprotein
MVPALGTFVRIELELPEAEFNQISSRAFLRIAELEKMLSFFDPESEISRLNQTEAGTWLRVSPETLEVLKLTTQLDEDSDGSFSVGNKLVFAGKKVRKANEQKIDLGGIAKGYIVDQAWIEILSAAKDVGIDEVHGSINAGGDLRMFERADVNVPIQSGCGKVLVHAMKKGALATSSVLKREGASAVYSKNQTARRETVTIEATDAWLADALTKVALFHPHPEYCLAKWKATLVHEA